MKHQVLEKIQGCCLVGHDILGDLQRYSLLDEVPSTLKGVGDTAYFGSLRERVHWDGAGLPSLHILSETLLKNPIQQEIHSALEDARATLKLYQLGGGQTSLTSGGRGTGEGGRGTKGRGKGNGRRGHESVRVYSMTIQYFTFHSLAVLQL